MFAFYDAADRGDVEEGQEVFSLVNYAAHFLEVKAKKFAAWRKFTCEICNSLELNGEIEWEKHLKTRKHKNKRRNDAKKQANTSNREYYENLNKNVAQAES